MYAGCADQYLGNFGPEYLVLCPVVEPPLLATCEISYHEKEQKLSNSFRGHSRCSVVEDVGVYFRSNFAKTYLYRVLNSLNIDKKMYISASFGLAVSLHQLQKCRNDNFV